VDWEKVPFGKVSGWIIDPDTKQPVNEEFTVYFYYIDENFPENPIFFDIKSDKKGYFQRKLVIGKYYIYNTPISDSRYCSSPNPLLDYENSPIIQIEKGKITKVVGKANIGGDIKVILVGPDGEKVNAEDVFKDKKYSVSVSSKTTGYSISIISTENTSIDKREFFFKNLPSGNYEISLFSTANILGIPAYNIKIQSKEMTEYKYVLYLNTGIEGTVTTTQNIPLNNAYIKIRNNSEPKIFARLNTNSDGYYKIIGLKPGHYTIIYTFEDQNGDFYGGSKVVVTITKGLLTKQNHILKMIKIQ
jgi:hypothetical protein